MEEQKLSKEVIEMDEFGQWEAEPLQVNKNKKIQAYFTPAVEKPVNEYYEPWNLEKEVNFFAPLPPCKPEHKVDGKVPMLYDLHFDGRSCDCGRVRYLSEECGCSIKEYRLIKIPNE